MRIITRPVRTTGTLLFFLALPLPAQTGLIDLATVGAHLRFDIRYATANNFLHRRFYNHPRAFLQRPAADALLRVAAALERKGYGLLIYDAYRPWSVTKMFWDAAPPGLRRFVAKPSDGSKHNRGCAVDLTLYLLKTGQPLAMPSGYDEMNASAHPDYKGGTAEERSNRDLLRAAMRAEGFTVNEREWWHFDHATWRNFPIMDVPFEKIATR